MSHWNAHPGVRTGSELSFGERASDKLKALMGTWSLLGLMGAGIALYLAFVKDPGELRLNLTLSCIAAVQGIVLQIAANRGDRISAEVALHTQRNTDELMELNRQQLAILNELKQVRALLTADAQDQNAAGTAAVIGAATALAAALIGSAPGWAGVLVAVRVNRRRLDEQTADLKSHVTDALAQKPPTPHGEAAQ